MKAGEMDRLIDIRQNTPTTNSFGEEIAAFKTLALVWAKVQPTQEVEKFLINQEVAFEIMDFTIRYSDTFRDYKLIIVWDGKTFDIVSIKEIGRREGLKITGKAQV